MISRASWLGCIVAASLVCGVHAQSTAFTYQGRLKNGTQPAAGLYDFRFTLFNAATGGVAVAPVQCVDNVSVAEGLFTTTIDFGQTFSTTTALFVQIEARADAGLGCGSGSGFTALSPRQPITAAPLATHAKAAYALDAADGSPASAVFVDNTGNVGVGTLAPQVPLHLKVSGQGIKIEGQSTGVTNSAYLAFANGAGTDIGWIGDGSSGDNNMYLTSYTGDVYLYTAAGATVAAKPSGNVGIGTALPAAKLDVRGDIRLGPTGQLRAPGGEENLRLLRGSIDGNGSIDAGAGFTCSRGSEGYYRITFDTPFASMPSVTLSAVQPIGQSPRWATLAFTSTASYLDIFVFTNSSDTTDSDFHFIVMGPR